MQELDYLFKKIQGNLSDKEELLLDRISEGKGEFKQNPGYN